jgi:uncharacterized glyoxalase superfamily protein PhnB
MFSGRAEEAMHSYVAVIPGSEIIDIVRYGPGQAGAEGSVMKAAFSIGGQRVLCTDSVVQHRFTFTPAMSFFVTCETDAEIRRLTTALSEGGAEFYAAGRIRIQPSVRLGRRSVWGLVAVKLISQNTGRCGLASGQHPDRADPPLVPLFLHHK